MKRWYILFPLLWIMAGSTLVFGQTGSSIIIGTITDPSNSVVPNAMVTVTEKDTGATFHAKSSADGLFRIVDLKPGAYSVQVEASHFKVLDVQDIHLESAETRDLGRLVLQIGEVAEKVEVTAQPTPVQTASSERSATIDSEQLDTLAMKGRDAFGLVGLLPGVVDTDTDRSLAGPGSTADLYVNGMSSNTKNVTFDGVTELDQGGANAVYVNPNVDAIGELKVVTNAYQAEYGRTAGGGVNIVTKSGTKDFHGSAFWQHRNEGLNADSPFDKLEGIPKPIYRYMIAGYSIGGPVFIPDHFNSDRTKLFFFVSQEFTQVAQPTQSANGLAASFIPGAVGAEMPTAAERMGNFSQSVGSFGQPITIIDPNTGKQAEYNGQLNVIPPDEISPLGQAILNLLPMPNGFVDKSFPPISNYNVLATPTFNRRDDIVRVDWQPLNSMLIYGRYGDDTSNTTDVDSVGPGIGTLTNFLPGNNLALHAVNTISSTLVNEVTVGIGHNNFGYYYSNGSKSSDFFRSTLGINTPTLRPFPMGSQYLPYVSAFSFFGGPLLNTGSFNPDSVFGIFPIPYKNFNNDYTVQDDVTKVLGNHSLKTGAFYEYNSKIEPLFGGNYPGSFNFGSTQGSAQQNPLDSGDGYANVLFGVFQSYTESSARIIPHPHFNEFEAYVQDSWRVTRRLTLDYGVRAYHTGITQDSAHIYAEFYPSLWNAAQAPVLYQEASCGPVCVESVNPLTHAVGPATLIDTIVPGSGNANDGISVNGKTGNGDFMSYPFLLFAPRVGFAWDVKGDGKTAIRASFGVFYNRPNANFLQGEGGAPVIQNPTILYSTFTQLAALTAAPVSPAAPASMFPDEKAEHNYQTNVTIQRAVGFNTVVDLAYVGTWDRDAQVGYALNPVPLGAYANPANFVNGAEIPTSLLENTYPGMGAVTEYRDNLAPVNYNALQAHAVHRLSSGLQFGVSYTYSHAVGTCGAIAPSTGSGDACSIADPYHNYRQWYYGPLPWDIRHNFSINYTYNTPSVTDKPFVKYIANYWTVSGIFEAQTGLPVTPSCTATGFEAGDPLLTDPSGTGQGYFNPSGFFPSAVGARCEVMGNIHDFAHSFNENFNTSAFSLAPVGTFGNSGVGILREPGFWNMDFNLAKNIPLGSERRFLQLRLEAYNVFNHTEFNGIGTTLSESFSGGPTPAVTPGFGAYSSARPARVLATQIRLEF